MTIESIQTFIKTYPELAFAIMAWILIWKVVALAKALHRKQWIWFLVILLINTFGILDIYYYYFVGKKDIKETEEIDEANQ